MVTTKEELIAKAVELVVTHPTGSALSGVTLSNNFATSRYETGLPAILEKFIYGFNIVASPLDNPEDVEGNENLKRYSIRLDADMQLGHIFSVCDSDRVPSIEILMGTKALNGVYTQYPYTLSNQKLLVNRNFFQDGKNQVVLFVNSNPPVSTMSASFKQYLMHDIAWYIALRQKDRHMALAFEMEKKMHREIAQKFALDNISSYNYIRPGLATAVLNPYPPVSEDLPRGRGNVDEYWPGD